LKFVKNVIVVITIIICFLNTITILQKLEFLIKNVNIPGGFGVI